MEVHIYATYQIQLNRGCVVESQPFCQITGITCLILQMIFSRQILPWRLQRLIAQTVKQRTTHKTKERGSVSTVHLVNHLMQLMLPAFKRPLAMQITAVKSVSACKCTKAGCGSGSKSIGEAAQRRLDYRAGTGTSNVSSPAASSAPASYAELPMAGIVTISLMFLLDW